MMDKRTIENIYPLSPLQEALLFNKLASKSDQGFLQLQCDLVGQLEVDLLKEAWSRVISIHESLRSSIQWKDMKKPVRVVMQSVKQDLEVLDWNEDDEDRFEQKLNELKQEDKLQGLDISRASANRVYIIRKSVDSWVMVWSFHHIFLDGWSSALILKDLVNVYGALCMGKTAEKVNSPKYRVYLDWFKEQDLQLAEHYWIQNLKEGNACLLGNTRGTGSKQYLEFNLSQDLTNRLTAYAKSERLTINSLLQGVWALLLNSYTDREDVIFGATVSGRNIGIEDINRMTGLFMNVQPKIFNVESSEEFGNWLQEHQIKLSNDLNFEHITLSQINDWSGKSELFDSLMIVENFPWQDLVIANLQLKNLRGGITSNYPLTLVIIPGDQLNVKFIYDGGVFDEKYIQQTADNFQMIIESIIKSPNTRVKEVQKAIIVPRMSSIEPKEIEEKHIENRLREPENPLQFTLLKIWEELFNRSDIDIEDNYFEIGGTSLMALNLSKKIEEQMGYKFPPISLIKYPTIKKIAETLDSTELQKSWETIVPLRSTGTKNPLFCIHAGGGQVFFYYPLTRRLPKDQPVYGLQLADQDIVKDKYHSIEQLSAFYLSEIQKIKPKGPYNLLGYCFSNAVCIEISRLLEKQGEKVNIFVIDSGPPPLDLGPIQRMVYLIRRKEYKRVLVKLKIRLANWGRGTVIEDQDKYFHSLLMKYKNKPFNDGITFIRSSEFSKLSHRDYQLGDWAKLAKGGVKYDVIDAHHLTIFYEPEVERLANALIKYLD